MKNKNGLPTILSPSRGEMDHQLGILSPMNKAQMLTSIIFLYVAVAASAFIFFRLHRHRHGGSKLILLFPLEISSYSN
jgi:hypothetical protein